MRPTSWTTIVIVPAARLKSVMLIGIRSPVSVTRTITNWPGAALRATSGAWTTNSLVMSVRSRFSMIRAVVSMVTLTESHSSGFSSFALSRSQRRSTSASIDASVASLPGLHRCFVLPISFSQSATGTRRPIGSGS